MTIFSADNEKYRISVRTDGDLRPNNDECLFYAQDLGLLNPEEDAWLEDLEVYDHSENGGANYRHNGLGKLVLDIYESKVAALGKKRIVAACIPEHGYLDELVSWYEEQGYRKTRKHGYTYVTKDLQ